jgi:hypothetical protein
MRFLHPPVGTTTSRGPPGTADGLSAVVLSAGTYPGCVATVSTGGLADRDDFTGITGTCQAICSRHGGVPAPA